MNTQRNWIKYVHGNVYTVENKAEDGIGKLCASQANETLKWMSSSKPELVYITWNTVIYQNNILASDGFRIGNTQSSALLAMHYTTVS